MKRDVADLKTLVARGETETVEFKRARGGIPADFWPTYSAFANTDGGIIVLGVCEQDGKRKIEGLPNAEKLQSDLWNAANNAERVSANVLFNSSVYSAIVDGKELLVVEVPRAERTDRPVHVGRDVFRGTYRRNGEGDYHCSREAVEGMIRDKCAETADHCIIDELALDDLNADTIRRYRIYFNQLRPGHVWNALSDDAFLLRIGAAVRTRDGKLRPNLAGLLCFGNFNEITNVLPYYFLDYREHLSPDVRWTDRICSGDPTWSGNIFDFFFRIGQSIASGVKVPFKIAADNITRIDDTDIHKALREVLANALIHADYHGRQGIVIDKYPKRLEVSNPGNFRIGKSVAIAGGTSDARNGKIFNIFSLVDIGERSGMGLSSIYGVWRREKYTMPSIEQLYEPDRTKVTVEFDLGGSCSSEAENQRNNVETLQKDVEEYTENRQKHTESIQKKPVDCTEKYTEGKPLLKGTELRIVAKVRENAHITQAELSRDLSLTRPYIARKMSALQSRGYLRHVGPSKGGHWETLS